MFQFAFCYSASGLNIQGRPFHRCLGNIPESPTDESGDLVAPKNTYGTRKQHESDCGDETRRFR
jgi:hypothetical protein